MLSESFKNVLVLIALKLELNKIPFIIIGSTNQVLQGMNLQPRDIDLAVHADNLQSIQELFKQFIITPKTKLTTTTEPAWHVILLIENVEIEFVGEYENGTYWKHFLANEYIFVKLDTLSLHCLELSSEIQAYLATNRVHKAEKIKQFIQQKNDRA